MKINNDKLWRRKCTKNMTKPNQSVSLRAIMDRTGSGLPVNARISQRTPLPPDGDNLDDYETGMEEYTDLVDVQHLDERIKKENAKKLEEKRKAEEEAKKKAFDEAVQAEVLKLQSNSSES